MYGQRYKSTGGLSIGFYASLRLRCSNPNKIKVEKTIHGKKYHRVVGVTTEVEVFKSSVWKPYHTAPVSIIFDYGIDDIRQNLQFVKEHTRSNVYTHHGESLSNSLEESCKMIEDSQLERKLRSEVIELWEEFESKFIQERRPKRS